MRESFTSPDRDRDSWPVTEPYPHPDTDGYGVWYADSYRQPLPERAADRNSLADGNAYSWWTRKHGWSVISRDRFPLAVRDFGRQQHPLVEPE